MRKQLILNGYNINHEFVYVNIVTFFMYSQVYLVDSRNIMKILITIPRVI